jgi:predicted nucleotidyltransferase
MQLVPRAQTRLAGTQTRRSSSIELRSGSVAINDEAPRIFKSATRADFDEKTSDLDFLVRCPADDDFGRCPIPLFD